MGGLTQQVVLKSSEFFDMEVTNSTLPEVAHLPVQAKVALSTVLGRAMAEKTCSKLKIYEYENRSPLSFWGLEHHSNV